MQPPSEPGPGDSGCDAELPDWARPAIPPPPPEFCVHDLINGRFEVVGSLGSGGMGHVYRVIDRRTGSERALKTLRSEFLHSSEFLRRFERELFNAQKITHTNVCRVYDIDTATVGERERPFFTMELLQGETLAQRLARCRFLTRKEALQVAHGIADGLDAAHTVREGIVHRDLKPANIMLIPEANGSRPVVLDFGVARSLDPHDQTGTDVRVGTPAYMAPEQLEGKPVTRAADIYALARILEEMLSVPDRRRYRRVLNRGLARNPADRPPTATALVAALDSVDQTRRNWIIAAAVALPASLGGAALARRKWPASVPGTPLVLLAPTTSTLAASSGRVLEPLAVTRLLEHQIDRSQAIELVPRARMSERARQLNGKELRDLDADGLSRIARAEGARYVLYSEVGLFAGRLQLHVSLLGQGRRMGDEVFAFNQPSELPGVCSDVADWLRYTLGRPGLKPRDPGMPELTTANWQAFEAYVRSDQAWGERREADAVRHLEEALVLDPEFAGAEARLGDILIASGRTDDGLARWARAAELARVKAPASREMLRIRGVFALDTGDFIEAERAIGLFRATFPEDPLAHFYYGSAAAQLNRPDQALEMMKRAVALQPSNYAYSVGLALTYLFRAEIEPAAQELRRAQPLGAGDGMAQQTLAAIAFGEGRLDDCARQLKLVAGNSNDVSKSRAFAALACLEAERSQLDRAAEWIQEGLGIDRRVNNPASPHMRLKAECCLAQGDRRAAIAACGEALQLAKGPQARMEIGCLLARCGAIREAEACRSRGLPAWPVYLHWSHRLEGEIALARGDAKLAVTELRKAPASPDNTYWPEFLCRAAMTAGDKPFAAGLASSMLRRLAYHWSAPYRVGLGFARLARGAL